MNDKPPQSDDEKKDRPIDWMFGAKIERKRDQIVKEKETEPLSEVVGGGIPWPGQDDDSYPDSQKLFDIVHVGLIGSRIARYYFDKDFSECTDDELQKVVRRLELEAEVMRVLFSAEVKKRIKQSEERPQSEKP